MSTLSGRASSIDDEQVAGALSELDRQGSERMRADGAPLDQVVVRRLAEVRYAGQSYELTVPIAANGNGSLTADVAASFHDLHERVYGHSDRGAPIEIVAVRTVHSLPVGEPRLESPHAAGSVEGAQIDARPAWFEAAGGYVETPRYDRARLPVEAEIEGPAVLEQTDTTVVVQPGQRARVDASGALIVERDTGA